MKNEIQGDILHIPDTARLNRFLIDGRRYADLIRTMPRDILRFRMTQESSATTLVGLLPRIEDAVAEWRNEETTGILHLRLGPPRNGAEAKADAQAGGQCALTACQRPRQRYEKGSDARPKPLPCFASGTKRRDGVAIRSAATWADAIFPRMLRPRYVMQLRRDFAAEVGWLGVVAGPASEVAWRDRRIAPATAAILGPDQVLDYQEYVARALRFAPGRLYRHMLWPNPDCPPDCAHISCRRFGANGEGGFLPAKNILFREMIVKAESALRFASGETSPLRPIGGTQSSPLPPCSLVHDSRTGEVWMVESELAYQIVSKQTGSDFQSTLAEI